jgi:hypothetical protein
MSNTEIDIMSQVGPCGVPCGACDLGSGKLANSSKKTFKLINSLGIKDWSPMVPGGAELDWAATEKTLDWMTKYAFCAGCEGGGGDPNCAIRICANEKGFELCSECNEIDECTKLDKLGDFGKGFSVKLNSNRGKTKEQIVAGALSK